MAELNDNSLFAIDVGPDTYAESAAADNPATNTAESRTFQSEAAFQAQKNSYSAKIDTGNHYAELVKAVPCLALPQPNSLGSSEAPIGDGNGGGGRAALGRKETMLLGYAVGEMYYDGEYERVVELCRRVEREFVAGGKVGESLQRWRERCEKRLEERGGV